MISMEKRIFLFDNLKSNIKIKRYKKLARCKIKFETKKSN